MADKPKNFSRSDLKNLKMSSQEAFDNAVDIAREGNPGVTYCGGRNGEGCGKIKFGPEFIFPNGTTVPCWWWMHFSRHIQDISGAIREAFHDKKVDLEEQLQVIAKKYGVTYTAPESHVGEGQKDHEEAKGYVSYSYADRDSRFTLATNEEEQQDQVSVFSL